jgi:hypothetical protein
MMESWNVGMMENWVGRSSVLTEKIVSSFIAQYSNIPAFLQWFCSSPRPPSWFSIHGHAFEQDSEQGKMGISVRPRCAGNSLHAGEDGYVLKTKPMKRSDIAGQKRGVRGYYRTLRP